MLCVTGIQDDASRRYRLRSVSIADGKTAEHKTANEQDLTLKPHLPDHKLVQQRLNYNQIKQKEYYDRGTNILKQLGQGEGVRVWKEGQWRPGIIQRRAAQPRSYIVQTEKGSMLRRDREGIKGSPEVTPETMVKNRPCEEIEIPIPPENTRPPENTSPILSQTPRLCGSPCKSPEKHSNSNRVESQVTTRSGRITSKPIWLKDFET